MEAAMHSLQSGIPTALIIWLTLIALSAGAFTLLAGVAYGRPGRRRRERTLLAPRPGGADSTTGIVLASEPATRDAAWPGWNRGSTRPPDLADARRYAEEIAIAAGRAGVTSVQRRAEWLRTHQVMEMAWLLYEHADSAARKASQTAAFPVLATPLTPAEYAERERYLHRAAYAAHLRGALSTDQLMDALSHRNGFDPSLHPCQQEAVLGRAARNRMLAAYQNAAAAERAAWHQADLAAAAKQSLDQEAFRAALRARDAQRRKSNAESPRNLLMGRFVSANLAMR